MIIKIVTRGNYHIRGKVLDIGCGDSYFDRQLANLFKDITIYGVDIYLKKEIHEERVHAVNSLEYLPDCKFDCIIMMDVLEHIKNDTEYLTNILKYLKPDGKVIITVPAFMKLYSLHDRELRHYRRYNHTSLHKVIINSGLTEIKWSYFYFSLIIGRLLTMNRTENLSGWKHSEKSFMTNIIKSILNADFDVLYLLSQLNIHLPGLSLLSVCRLKKRSKKQ